MIKALTATTRKIDDAQDAVNEALITLNLENNLLKNSLGIISCFSGFEETGVLKAICNAMPFDCIGSTTSDHTMDYSTAKTIYTGDAFPEAVVSGMNDTVEAEKVIELTGGSRYLFAYTGGEICPLPDSSGKLKNVYHNFTVVSCRLSKLFTFLKVS